MIVKEHGLCETRARMRELRTMIAVDADDLAMSMCDTFELWVGGTDANGSYSRMREGITDVIMAELAR